MCNFCSNIHSDYDIFLPEQYAQTLKNIQGLINHKQLILVKGNRKFDEINENGCWAEDEIYYILKCPECGQLFHCTVDTFHGNGVFARDRVIIDQKLYNDIWDRLFNQYLFKPRYADWHAQQWLKLPEANVTYNLSNTFCWNDNQEKLVNSFFESLVQDDMYALDWQHDCFIYSPKEHIRSGFQYHDYLRGCNVYFPSYCPDGDYYFFVDKDWKYGLFGHPWKSEIKVMGQELINLFESNSEELEIKQIQI